MRVYGGILVAMKYFKNILVGIGVISLFFYTPYLLARAASPVVALEGMLQDVDGSSIVGVSIRMLAYHDGDVREGSFNKVNGRYSFTLEPGDWSIIADPPASSGFSPKISAPIVLASSDTVVTKNMALDRYGAIIFGRVSAPEGGLLKKALINIINIFAKDGSYVSSSEVDANGFYASPVPAGTYSVSAYSAPVSELVTPEVQNLTVKNGDLANLKFAFKRPTATVSGKVHLFADNATVYAWSDTGRQAQTTTDKDGRYTLRLAAQDTWHLRASKKVGSTISYRSKEITLPKIGENASLKQDLWFLEVSFLPADGKAEFQNGKSATVKLTNGMRVSVPPNIIPGNFEMRVSPFMESSPMLTGPVYEIGFYTAQGSPVLNIQNGVSIIQIPYTSESKNVSHLRIVFWDPDSEAWRFAPQSVVDTEKKTVTGFIKFNNFLARVGVAPPEEPRSEPPPPATEELVIVGPSEPPPSIEPSGTEPVTPPPAGPVGETEPPPPPPPPSDEPTGSSSSGPSGPTSPTGSGGSTTFSDGSSTPPPPSDSSTPASSGGVPPPPPPPPASSSGAETASSDTSSSETGTAPSDTTAPEVADLLATITGDKAVTITWTTSEPASTKLDCGGNIAITQPNNITTNIHTIIGIEAKPYTCTVTSTDIAGNASTKQLTFLGSAPIGTEVKSGELVVATVPQSSVSLLAGSANLIVSDLFVGVSGQGTAVQALQKVLNGLGFAIAATGPGSVGNESTFFGPATQKAVIAFQISKGLPATGYVGALTRAALKTATGNAPASPAPTTSGSGSSVSGSGSFPFVFGAFLTLGSTGVDVVNLQTILEAKGLLQLPPGVGKGFYGNLTAQAVSAYQLSKGFAPTGSVGPLTRAALNAE